MIRAFDEDRNAFPAARLICVVFLAALHCCNAVGAGVRHSHETTSFTASANSAMLIIRQAITTSAAIDNMIGFFIVPPLFF